MLPALPSDQRRRNYQRPLPAMDLPPRRALRALDPLGERLRPMHDSLETAAPS